MPIPNLDAVLEVKALEAFQDGNILPQRVRVGEVIKITAGQYDQILRSGGRFEIVQTFIKNPEKKAAKDEA